MKPVRGAIAALLGVVLAACAATAQPGASHSALTIDGPIEQGSVIRGTAAPGARASLDGKPLMVDDEGRFVFGFDRDAAGDAVLGVTWPNGDEETRKLTIAARTYDIQRISGLPEAQVTPPPDQLDRIKREAAEKAAARKPDTQGSWFAEKFIWPAAGPVSGVFGSQRILNGEPRAPHYGVDVAAPEGAPIHAPAGGVVTLAEPDMYFEGGLVFIDHGHGLISYLMHMSKVEAHAGQMVKQGDEIGLVGHTGRATAHHVHWGMFWLGAHIDPQLLIPPAPPAG
jgi:murein DD-endopeptidase MepM/ murein hydrolase activator NlpD